MDANGTRSAINIILSSASDVTIYPTETLVESLSERCIFNNASSPPLLQYSMVLGGWVVYVQKNYMIIASERSRTDWCLMCWNELDS